MAEVPDEQQPGEGPGRPPRRGAHRVHLPHLDHPHLIDADEDRWAWRAAIRRDPCKLFFYRIAVGVAGLVMVIASIISGPLPGPGGIPLFLLGLAVWASEFEWAQNVMVRFKKLLNHYLGWPRHRKVLFWVAFFTCCGLLAYAAMIVIGPPPWLPNFALRWLGYLPGL